jgi:precorrin-3B methylase
MTRDEWKEWLAKSWDEAQARAKHMTMIKTWQERCEEHPDHEGIVNEQMIRNRMQEEIDELRQAIEQAETREWVGLTKEDMPDGDNPMFDTNEFYAGMAWAEIKLKEKNHG